MVSEALLDVLREGQSHGLIGRAPLEEHVLHSQAFVSAAGSFMPAQPWIIDLGSGAGLPGLVIAELLPEARVVLVESRQQRASLLQESVHKLRLADRVHVVGERAEIAGRDTSLRGRFDVVTARSFARPAITAECGAPFLHLGGVLIVSEPPDPSETARRWPESGVARLGLRIIRRLEAPRSLVVLQLDSACPDTFPRRAGIPEKRPLF